MNNKQKGWLLVLIGIGVTILTSLILGILHYLGVQIPNQTIPVINVAISRWWDIFFAPIYIDIIIACFLFLDFQAEKDILNRDASFAGLVAGLVVSFLAGLGIGLGIGFVTGLVVSLVAGLSMGLTTGLGIGLVKLIHRSWPESWHGSYRGSRRDRAPYHRFRRDRGSWRRSRRAW